MSARETKPSKITASFNIDREVMATLRGLVGKLKVRATRAGHRADTMSEIVEAAIKAECRRRKQLKS